MKYSEASKILPEAFSYSSNFAQVASAAAKFSAQVAHRFGDVSDESGVDKSTMYR